jgi:hypothetical protein
MAVQARVSKDADGRWNFEGDMSRVPGDSTAGGGGAAAGVTDIRFNEATGWIDASMGGVWVPKVEFLGFDG